MHYDCISVTYEFKKLRCKDGSIRDNARGDHKTSKILDFYKTRSRDSTLNL